MARPKKEIDWERVDELMEVGSPAAEISDQFDINHNTFYERFKEHYGFNFQDYRMRFHSIGKANLRRSQYEKAIEGNTQMLTLLGKLWLDQVDIEPTPKNTEEFNSDNKLMEKEHENNRLKELLKQNNIEFDVQDKPEAEQIVL